MKTQLWYPKAVRVAATHKGTTFTVPLQRVVHHITVSGDAGSMPLFDHSTYWPGFLVRHGSIEQHYPVNVGGRALENAPGGVATNGFGAVQIETIGRPGVNLDHQTLVHLVELLRWLREEWEIPWVWPNGRPKPAKHVGNSFVDPGGHDRSVSGWRKPGQFGHSQVPENHHYDPCYTDHDWGFLMASMTMHPHA